jgi:hypothetical protein
MSVILMLLLLLAPGGWPREREFALGIIVSPEARPAPSLIVFCLNRNPGYNLSNSCEKFVIVIGPRRPRSNSPSFPGFPDTYLHIWSTIVPHGSLS